MILAFVFATHALLQAAQVGTAPAARDPRDSSREALRRDNLSMAGLPGLINVPTASSTPSGMVDFAFTTAKTQSALPNVKVQRNAFIAFGFLPRISISLRGTVRQDTLGNEGTRDLSDNVQVLLFTEGRRTPAFAIGAQDAFSAGATYFKARYAVASKSFADRYRLTVGYGLGPTLLKGIFGGAEIFVTRWAAALGEFDGRKYNAGLRLLPLPALADWAGVQPRVDVAWQQGAGVAVALGLRTSLSGHRDGNREESRDVASRLPATSAVRPSPVTRSERSTIDAGHARESDGGTRAVTAELVAQGFENVRSAVVSDAGSPTLAVEYENRRFNRDELDALGIVMAVAARYAPDSVTRMRVTIRRVDVPVIVVASGIALYRAFIDDPRASQSFADQLDIISPAAGRTAANMLANGGAADPSRFKLDLFGRPRIETAVLTELGIFESRESLMADAWMQLAPGVVLNARRTVATTESPNFPSFVSDPNSDRLLLHVARPLPWAAHLGLAGALTQLSIGRFGHTEVGVADEVDVPLLDGRVSLGATLGVLGTNVRNLDRAVALAVARVRYAPWDVTASLTAGRFRNGDAGAMGELSRFFGNTALTLYLKSTELASVAGMRVELPLAPARELAPARIRPRFPDVHKQGLQATVFTHVAAELHEDVGLLLETDHDIARAYRSRDRLQAVTIRMHVESIREAALRWLTNGHP